MTVVAAINPDSDSVTLVDAHTLAVLREINVGDDPTTLAFTPDSELLLVANRGSASVSVVTVDGSEDVTEISVGPMPYGVVTSARRAFVAEFALGNIGIIDLNRNEVIERISIAPFPAGLAIRSTTHIGETKGDYLLVTHLFTGQVTAIDLQSLSIRAEATTGAGINISQFIAIDPEGMRAYLPQTRSNASNTALTFDTTVFPVVNVLDLSRLTLLPRERITIDTADQPVNMPSAVALSPDGHRLFVANAGSDDLSVIDLVTGQGVDHIDVGANPRGLGITPDGERLFVNNVLDGTMSVIETETLRVIEVVSLTRIPLSPDVLLRKKIFNSASAPLLTTDNWISCATCHFDAGMDGRTWLGFPDGPRNTPALFGVGQTLPIHWSGDLDELHDVELTIRAIQFGKGLITGGAHDSLGPPHAGLSGKLDALTAYMESLEHTLSPYDTEQETMRRGESIFGSIGCQSCHAPPLYTDLQIHDVGTGDPASEKNTHGRGTNFDIPSLLGIWFTAPYLHDGTAATIADVLQTGTAHNVMSDLDRRELSALIAFMRGLPMEALR